jgi:hypothetical protein
VASLARSEYTALDSCVYLNRAAPCLIPTRTNVGKMLRFMSEVAQYGNRGCPTRRSYAYSSSFEPPWRHYDE